MSSSTRAHGIAQTPERTKFYKCFDSRGLDYVTDISMNVFLNVVAAAGGSVDGAVNVVARVVSTNVDPAPVPAVDVNASGAVIRDMGRQISIYTTAGGSARLHFVYRHCQWQLGADTEGVAGSSPTWVTHWVLTWSADGSDSVQVVRVG